VLPSLHNHTRWSDGSDTLSAYIHTARSLGVNELGISDHYTLSPCGPRPAWSMRPDDLDAYVRDIVAATGDRSDVTVRLGIEADFFPETVGMLRAQLTAHPLDYVIGSVHFVDRFSVDTAARDWERLSADERNTVWRHYWQRVRQLAESRVYDVVAHLDVPKKYGYRPTVGLLAETEAALDAIAAADMAVEPTQLAGTRRLEKPTRHRNSCMPLSGGAFPSSSAPTVTRPRNCCGIFRLLVSSPAMLATPRRSGTFGGSAFSCRCRWD